MDSKILNFHIYRYHLLPIDKTTKQLDMFPNKTYSFEQIKKKKNDFFGNILDLLVDSKSNTHPLKLEIKDKNYYVFKIAKRKPNKVPEIVSEF